MNTINPYLNFEGHCEEAFNFYRSVFGGEFIQVSKFKDMPAEFPISEAEKEKLMHIGLVINKETIIHGSDTSAQYAGRFKMGTNISLTVNTDNKGEADRVFVALSAGGKVDMPMSQTFWGAYFGMFTDKFGIQWMVSYEKPPVK